MNKNQMAELLYALPDGVVVKGRKSKVVPLCLTLAGVVSLVVNGLLPATAGYEDLKSALVLFGGLIFAAGVLLLFVRLFGDSGVPLYGENRVPLVWSERYYPKSAASAVADCLTRHDWARLRSIAQSQVPAIRLGGLPYARRGVRGLPGVRIRRVGGAAPHGVAHRAFRPRGVAEYVVMRRGTGRCAASSGSPRFREPAGLLIIKWKKYVVNH